jgi:hypothetical protein
MRTDDDAPSRYLVEWYAPGLRGRAITEIALRLRRSLASMPAPDHAPTLLYALEVPQDAYAFGVFSADSADEVALVCQQAGLPADRVSEALEAPAAEAE